MPRTGPFKVTPGESAASGPPVSGSHPGGCVRSARVISVEEGRDLTGCLTPGRRRAGHPALPGSHGARPRWRASGLYCTFTPLEIRGLLRPPTHQPPRLSVFVICGLCGPNVAGSLIKNHGRACSCLRPIKPAGRPVAAAASPGLWDLRGGPASSSSRGPRNRVPVGESVLSHLAHQGPASAHELRFCVRSPVPTAGGPGEGGPGTPWGDERAGVCGELWGKQDPRSE